MIQGIKRTFLFIFLIAAIILCSEAEEQVHVEIHRAEDDPGALYKKQHPMNISQEGKEDTYKQDGNVTVLGQYDFHQFVRDNFLVLVEFYAPWCSHCKDLAPEFEKAAATLKLNNPPLPLAKVDITVEKELFDFYDIQSTPTLKVFREGMPYETYDGPGTETALVKFMKNKVYNSPIPLQTAANTTEFVRSANVTVLGLFGTTVRNMAAKIFHQVAENIEEFRFGISAEPEVLMAYENISDVAIVFKTFDEPRVDIAIDHHMTPKQLAQKIRATGMRLIERLTDDRHQAIYATGIQKHGLVFANTEGPGFAEFETEMKAVARLHRGNVLFILVPLSEKRMYDSFGIKQADLPKFILIDMSVSENIKKYFYEGPFIRKKMRAFVDDVLIGKVKPTLKSEEPHLDDLSGTVKVVKGKSFHDMVINNTMDVMLEFYAPWCQHCQEFETTYVQLAETFENHQNLIFAKIDGTQNEISHPKVSVKGFPTLYLFPGLLKDHPIPFSGSRDIHTLISFVLDNVKQFNTEEEEEDEHDDTFGWNIVDEL